MSSTREQHKGRNMRIQAAYLGGKSVATLVEEFNLGEKRIRQIIDPVRHIVDSEYERKKSYMQKAVRTQPRARKQDPDILWAKLAAEGKIPKRVL